MFCCFRQSSQEQCVLLILSIVVGLHALYIVVMVGIELLRYRILYDISNMQHIIDILYTKVKKLCMLKNHLFYQLFSFLPLTLKRIRTLGIRFLFLDNVK
jgi:hypothetical protein